MHWLNHETTKINISEISNTLCFLLLLVRPPLPYRMISIGRWYYSPEQRIQGHYTLSLYYVKLIICTPALIPVLSSFLGVYPLPCLLTHIRPILPLPLPSSLPPPNIDHPVTTTAKTPSPPASKRTAHRGPESVSSQYTVRLCHAFS